MNEVGRSAVESKFMVAVEDIVIRYYEVEADSEQDAMDNYHEGVHISTKPKNEEIIWVKEIA